MRGEGKVGVRLVLSVCVLVILGALVWSAFSVLSPSGTGGIPSPVVKAIPPPPTEGPPFLRPEEEDSRIKPSPSAVSSPAEAEATDRGSAAWLFSPTEHGQAEGPLLEPQGAVLVVEPKGEGLDKAGLPDEKVQRKRNGQARGQLDRTSTRDKGVRPHTSQSAFTIHVESFQEEIVAQQRAEFFRRSGLDSFCLPVDLPGKGIWHRVLVGTFADRSEAEAVRSSLEREKGLRGTRVVPLQRKKS